MSRTLLVLVFLGMAAVVGGAQDGGDGDKRPRSSAVRRATTKRDRAVEQADAAYRKAAADANKALLAELKKAKEAAITAKDLDEANAIVALIAETGQAVEQQAGGKGAKRIRLAVDPTKGTWVESSGVRGTYRNAGRVRFDTWNADGKWEVISSHTIAQHEPNGMRSTITFTADGRHALWVFSDGGVNWARRAE